MQRQIEIRRERARRELPRYRITSTQPQEILSLYRVKSGSGYTYDVEIRNPFELENRCSCPDYESNGLGTCKHIEAVLIHLEREHPRQFKEQRERIAQERTRRVTLNLTYQDEYVIKAAFDPTLGKPIRQAVGKYFTRRGQLKKGQSDPRTLVAVLHKFESEVAERGGEVQIGEEVWAFAEGVQGKASREEELAGLMERVKAGELEIDLLKYPLYPYQMLGTLFLAFTQRALLGDDMGLGKTIQALAACIFLKGQGKLRKVLIICPASLKLQWAKEIRRFSDETVTVIMGPKARREKQYGEDTFFKILNYELVLRDFDLIQALAPDLIILDEAQRIKNWRAKTTQLIKNLTAEYAYVLTGTPLENRLDELYSIVQFLDRRLLGPAWQFMAEHVVRDEWGAVVGYRGLDRVKRKIAPIFLRRRKDEVLHELPERMDNYYYVELDPAQTRLYLPREAELRSLFAVPKEEWTPQMMGRLLQLITEMREICDAAQLVSDSLRASSKLTELPQIIEDVAVGDGHKVLVFSQWERMTRLVEEALCPLPLQTVRLHGGLSLRQREQVIERFNQDADCRVFISTDAGGLGLNLQAADFVVNVDLPWNPAKLEQRVGRAHRIGQKKAVNVINLVVSDSIEERVLEVIYEKQRLFHTMFDTDIDEINLKAVSRVEEMRQVVEELLAEE
ncbi:MAG: DEAD/DEAH box helicase [Anaerolineae bacterium]